MSVVSTNDRIRFRIRLVAILLIPVAVALAVRLYFVQIVAHEYYLDKARDTYTTTRVTSGKRGEIFDVHGNLLVSNIPSVNITADPSHIKNSGSRRRLAYLLAREFPETSCEDFFRKLAPTRRKRISANDPNPDGSGFRTVPNTYAMIARDVSLEKAARLKALARVNKFRCLFFKDSYKRIYPKGSLLSNVLGFTNIVDDNDVAQTGLEKFFDEQMTAQFGRETYERDRSGRPLLYGPHISQEARDGRNIYLTISEPIQSILEEELDVTFREWKPKTLYAALVDPKTGNVLAMAQRPTFDPNDRSTYTNEAGRPRIAEDGIEPGSIIKPFTIGKALDWGYVTPETEIDCDRGTWIYLGKPLRDSHPYDKLTVAGVIQKSSNIGTAKIAMLLGEEKVYEALRMFGFGQKTNLPFRTETAGYLPRVPKWDGLSITRFPIGYGVRVSPLQMLRAYCALANNGKLPQLRLVDRLEDPATGVVEQIPVKPPVQLFEHPECHRQLIDMMTLVTKKGGTAARAALPGYEVAGKTGTSRKYIPGRGYASGKYFSSFVGFVPARNPAFVMLVTVDEPHGAYYASTVAAPTFKRVAERVLRHMNIPPDPALLPEKNRTRTNP